MEFAMAKILRLEERKLVSFDPAQNFSEVWGKPGVAFEQNGIFFNARREMLTTEALRALDPKPEEIPEEDPNIVPRFYIESEEPKSVQKTQNFETMHWKHLQQMLKVYGENYINREQAIKFLNGRS